MTWIRTVPPAHADPELRKAYEAVYALYPPEYRTAVPSLRGRIQTALARPIFMEQNWQISVGIGIAQAPAVNSCCTLKCSI